MNKLLLAIIVTALILPANAQLVSYWNFDEGSGTTVNDLKSNLDGTNYGATWTTGKFDSALSFDSSDRVVVGDYPALEYFNQVTICTWVNWTGSGVRGFLAGKEWVYKIDIENSKIRFLTGNAWAGSILTSNTALTPNTWYHIAAVYDGTQKRIYINGMQDLNVVNTTGSMNYSSWSFTMGAQPNSSGFEDYFRGKMDELRVYNNALTQQEILALMTIPEPASVLLIVFGSIGILRKKRPSLL